MHVKRRRKRIDSSTAPPVPGATSANAMWAVNFQFDSTTDERPIKIGSIVDEHTRECLGGLLERSITAEVPASELNRIAYLRGASPAVLRRTAAATSRADWNGSPCVPPGITWAVAIRNRWRSRLVPAGEHTPSRSPRSISTGERTARIRSGSAAATERLNVDHIRCGRARR